MANTKSQAVLGPEPMPSPVGSEVVNVKLQVEVPVTGLEIGDLIILGEIPEDCVMVDAIYFADDLDTGTPAVAFSFGTINAGETDLTTVIEAALDIGEAGTASRLTPTVANLAILGGTSGAPVGYKVTTIPATAAAGTLGVSLSYRSVHHET